MTASAIAAGPAVQKANLETVQRDLTEAGEYARKVWTVREDEDPIAQLLLSQEALIRAVSTLTLVVEAQDRQIAYLKARNQYQEAYAS